MNSELSGQKAMNGILDTIYHFKPKEHSSAAHDSQARFVLW